MTEHTHGDPEVEQPIVTPPGKSEDAPGHDPEGPGQSEDAPGQNKPEVTPHEEADNAEEA